MRKIDQCDFRGLHQKITSFLMQIAFYCNRYFQDEDALIVVCGDFNADHSEVPLEAIGGDVEDTDNPQLAKRVLIPCERTIPESSRYSLLHHGKGEMLDHILVSRSLLALGSVLPWLAGCFDLLENARIITMARSYPVQRKWFPGSRAWPPGSSGDSSSR